jgi:Zn-finger nucleic acid-binding protein
MQCPIDGTTLQMSDRQGIEIDYCPTCRGVWLDRGELDKIIERSAAAFDDDDDDDRYRDRPRTTDYREPARSEGQHRGDSREPYRPEDRRYEGEPYRKKKKRSILEDLFDFG